MIFWVMIQLVCVNCCWFTPVWARTHLKLHRSFYRQGLQNGPPVLFPCTDIFYCVLSAILSVMHEVIVPTYHTACASILFPCLLLWWSFICLSEASIWRIPLVWGGSWEGSVSCTDGLANPLSPRMYCQTPPHSSNFPKLLTYPGHRLGSTMNGNFNKLENSSMCFPPPVTPCLVFAEFSFIH